MLDFHTRIFTLHKGEHSFYKGNDLAVYCGKLEIGSFLKIVHNRNFS
jgi:hypothetical protein